MFELYSDCRLNHLQAIIFTMTFETRSILSPDHIQQYVLLVKGMGSSILDYTVSTKKKVHVPEMWPIYSGRYGPIEKPYVRELSRSKRVAVIWGFKVSIFCYLVIIFSCAMFWMKHSEIHTIDRCYQEENPEFFTEFFDHILHRQRGLKWKEPDFNTFGVVQYVILRVPSNKSQRIK